MTNNDPTNAVWIMDTAGDERTGKRAGCRPVSSLQVLKQWLPVSAARSQSASRSAMTSSDVTR